MKISQFNLRLFLKEVHLSYYHYKQPRNGCVKAERGRIDTIPHLYASRFKGSICRDCVANHIRNIRALTGYNRKSSSHLIKIQNVLYYAKPKEPK